MLDKINVKLTIKIMYDKKRDPETQPMTTILNARDSYSLKLYQMVKVDQDLTNAPVSSAKYLILGKLKNRKPALYKLLENRSHKV